MKKIKFILLSILITIIVAIELYIHTSFIENIPVLAYHDVQKDVSHDTNIEIKKFEKQIKWLSNRNYKSLSLDEFYKWKNGTKISGKKIVITFDDGKKGTYLNAIKILEKYNFKATIFIIEDQIGKDEYMSKKDIDDIKKNHPLIKLESHSKSLHNQDIAMSNNYEIYNNDMKITKKKYNFFAYPFGYTNENYIKSLKNNKYKMAFKFAPSKWVNINDDNYTLNRVPIYNSTSMIKFIIKTSLKLR